MQTRLWSAFVAVLAMGPVVAGSLEPGTDGPAPLLDGAQWELRQRGITPDEPDPWVNEGGDRMVGALTFVDGEDAVTARIEAGSGDAAFASVVSDDATVDGVLRAGTATITGALSAGGDVVVTGTLSAHGLSAGGGMVRDVGPPSTATDAATKGYVDASLSGLARMRIASVRNLNIDTGGSDSLVATLAPDRGTALLLQSYAMQLTFGGGPHRLQTRFTFHDGASVSDSVNVGFPGSGGELTVVATPGSSTIQSCTNVCSVIMRPNFAFAAADGKQLRQVDFLVSTQGVQTVNFQAYALEV